MPTASSEPEVPDNLKPYLFHGVNLRWKGNDKNAVAEECPFCGRPDKFGVLLENGKFRCVVCGDGEENEGGNVFSFIRKVWEISKADHPRLDELAEDRKLLNVETLKAWGLVVSNLTDDILIPGYNADGVMVTLYKYIYLPSVGRMMCMPTPTLNQRLFRPIYANEKASTLYLCEGIWDAMALWEMLALTKQTGDGYALTANEKVSLLGDANVIAIASNLAFTEPMLKALHGKEVILMAQNDHPGKNEKTGKDLPPASYAGMHRIIRLIHGSDYPPKSVKLLHWGEHGFNPELKSGYDLRDCLQEVGI